MIVSFKLLLVCTHCLTQHVSLVNIDGSWPPHLWASRCKVSWENACGGKVGFKQIPTSTQLAVALVVFGSWGSVARCVGGYFSHISLMFWGLRSGERFETCKSYCSKRGMQQYQLLSQTDRWTFCRQLFVWIEKYRECMRMHHNTSIYMYIYIYII